MENISKKVIEQYENYPYPRRDPSEEKERLIPVFPSSLPFINHIFWSGQKDFSNFYVLDAGCGTGDSTVYLAEQLKDGGGHVVSLDFSKKSLEITKERAKMRNLNNVTFIQDSVLNIPNLGLKKFDYIVCIGVLHHLQNPDEGMQILGDRLKPDGGMGIMVYGQYGRMAVYQMQELMRLINKDAPMQEKIKNARLILKSLPESNWFAMTQHFIRDLNEGMHGEAGMVDLLLHAQDRAYTVPELYKFVNRAGLKIVRFLEHIFYRPETFLSSAEPVLEKIKQYPEQRQQAIAELLHSRIMMHTTFLVKEDRDILEPLQGDDLEGIPCFILIEDKIKEIVRKGMRNDINFPLTGMGMKIDIRLNPVAQSIILKIDEKKTLGNILEEVVKIESITQKKAFKEWKRIYNPLNMLNFLVLNRYPCSFKEFDV